MTLEHPEAVYIMASRPRGALYIGRTKDLVYRRRQHRNCLLTGHTQRYRITKLVYFEWHDGWEAAWRREQQIKRYRRAWKFNLIEDGNPGWKDLRFEITDSSEILFPPIN
ncbi:GIY-YIG nuclease family protein [Maricaulis sp. MIT060901]|uniref:GIY-YIG nuclease family protein n=1 Tax=Maricaulis sp. MIT060901 TaxID=3096993 RepID=UPI00399BE751